MTRIPIVNEADEIIDYKERSESTVHDIDRIAALWITDAEGRVLLAQRALTKRFDPGLWGPAVAGTVEEGETYVTNILKEASEEIGLSLTESDLVVGPKMRTQDEIRNCFCQWFFHTLQSKPESLVIQEDEVAQIAWLDTDSLRRDVETDPSKFTPGTLAFIKDLLSV
jgi:isopentenyldiphosphate isomerase